MKKIEQLEKTLVELGLSENESRLYISALSLGTTTVLKLSRASGIRRTTIYPLIDSLKGKGLMKESIIGFKTQYEAESPEKLQLILDQRKDKLQKDLPDFLSLFQSFGGNSVIRHYEGIESIKPLYIESLEDVRKSEDYLVITNQEQWYGLDSDYFQKYKEKRARTGARVRMLFQDSLVARTHKKFEKNFSEEIRFLPPETIINVDFVCTPRRVVIFQTTQPYNAIVIENKFVVEMYQNLFNVIWDRGSTEKPTGD